ncbi:nucleic acid/nucleotide deaminase domain-containing protein [Streptomyces sp. NPDC020681]|uniref:nucleic acid/nucleotide deaminase domain-containing protein n=1 Tax=Streptomyces sp. NPDC020681 TaxID=3365083 RepID=UPI0037A11129
MKVLSAEHRLLANDARKQLGKLSPARYEDAQKWAAGKISVDHQVPVVMGEPNNEVVAAGKALVDQFIVIVAYVYARDGDKKAASVSQRLAMQYGTQRTTGLVGRGRPGQWHPMSGRGRPHPGGQGVPTRPILIDNGEHGLSLHEEETDPSHTDTHPRIMATSSEPTPDPHQHDQRVPSQTPAGAVPVEAGEGLASQIFHILAAAPSGDSPGSGRAPQHELIEDEPVDRELAREDYARVSASAERTLHAERSAVGPRDVASASGVAEQKTQKRPETTASRPREGEARLAGSGIDATRLDQPPRYGRLEIKEDEAAQPAADETRGEQDTEGGGRPSVGSGSTVVDVASPAAGAFDPNRSTAPPANRRPPHPGPQRAGTVEDPVLHVDRRIRFRDASLVYERNLGTYLASRPEANELAGRILAAVWEKADTAQRALMGTNEPWSAGAVGTDLAELQRVVDSGNLRERMNMLYWADGNRVLSAFAGKPKWPAQMKAEWAVQRSRTRTPEELTDLSADEVVPPLSDTERALSVQDGRLLWWPGSKTREIQLFNPTHHNADATGGLVFAGTSKTTYFLFYAVHSLQIPVNWQEMRLLMMATMLQVRHHTYHEIMTAADLFGQHYLHSDALHYQDDWGRHRNLPPLTENELRTHVATDGRFPDEHALGVGPEQTLNDPHPDTASPSSPVRPFATPPQDTEAISPPQDRVPQAPSSIPTSKSDGRSSGLQEPTPAPSGTGIGETVPSHFDVSPAVRSGGVNVAAAMSESESAIANMAHDGSIRWLSNNYSYSDLTATDRERVALPRYWVSSSPSRNNAHGMPGRLSRTSSRQVAPGSTDLSRATQIARHADRNYGANFGKFKSDNYAAARITSEDDADDFILVTRSNWMRHSERMIGIPFLRKGDGGRIRELYTEREPCSDCSSWLAERLPHVQVSHGFEYGDTRDSKIRGNAAMQSYLEQVKLSGDGPAHRAAGRASSTSGIAGQQRLTSALSDFSSAAPSYGDRPFFTADAHPRTLPAAAGSRLDVGRITLPEWGHSSTWRPNPGRSNVLSGQCPDTVSFSSPVRSIATPPQDTEAISPQREGQHLVAPPRLEVPGDAGLRIAASIRPWGGLDGGRKNAPQSGQSAWAGARRLTSDRVSDHPSASAAPAVPSPFFPSGEQTNELSRNELLRLRGGDGGSRWLPRLPGRLRVERKGTPASGDGAPAGARRVRFALDPVASVSTARIERIGRKLQDLENERTRLRRVHGLPDPSVPGESSQGYPTVPVPLPDTPRPDALLVPTPDATPTDTPRPRPLGADEQLSWVKHVVESEVQGYGEGERAVAPGSAVERGEPSARARRVREVRDRALAYLRDLQREVVFAPRGDEGAPARSVEDRRLTLPVTYLEADRPAFLDLEYTDPSFEEGANDVFEDGSSLGQDVTSITSTVVTLRAPKDVVRTIVDVLSPQESDKERVSEDVLSLLADRHYPLRARLESGPRRSADDTTVEEGKPPSLLGGGVFLPFRGTEGRNLVARIRGRNTGSYSRYADAYVAAPEVVHRNSERSEKAWKQASNRTFGLSTTAWPGVGSSAMVSVAVAGSYNQTSHLTAHSHTSRENRTVRTANNSSTYVNDMAYDVEVYEQQGDGTLRVVEGRGKRFVVRNGFRWRVSDGLTSKREGPAGLPQEIRIPSDAPLSQITAEEFAPSPELIGWALKTAHRHGGVTLGTPAAEDIFRSFRRDTMADRVLRSMRGEVRTPDLQDERGNVVGHFSYRVVVDHDKTAVLERPVDRAKIIVNKNTESAVSRSREVNKSGSATVSAGPVESFARFYARFAVTTQISTARSDPTSVTDSGTVRFAVESQGLQGRYRSEHFRVQVTFHPGYGNTGLRPPPHLKDARAELTKEFPAQVLLRLPAPVAREWGGWDSGTGLRQWDDSAVAETPAQPADLPPAGPDPPPELAGSIMQIMPYHSGHFEGAKIMSPSVPKRKPPRRKGLPWTLPRAQSAVTVASAQDGKAPERRRIAQRTRSSPMLKAPAATTHSGPQTDSPTLELLTLEPGASTPSDESPAHLDELPLADQMTNSILHAMSEHSHMRPFIKPAPSAYRRLAGRASHQASRAMRGAGRKMRDAYRTGGGGRRTVRQPSTLRYRNPGAQARNALWNKNQRLATDFSPLRLDTRLRLLFNPQTDEYTVVLTREGHGRRHELTLTVEGGQWEKPRWMGLRPDLSIDGQLSGATGTSQSSRVTQGWQAGPGLEGGLKYGGPKNRILAGLVAVHGHSTVRGTASGLEAGRGHGVYTSRAHVFETTGTIRVKAHYGVRPRTLLRLTTGNWFRQAPRPMALSGGKDGALVLKVKAQILHPDALMPDRLRQMRRDPGQDTQPVPPDRLPDPLPLPLPLSGDQALALLATAREGGPSPAETVQHNHLRVSHAKPVADLVRSVLAELSPGETAWAFRTPGTQEYQTVEVFAANGGLEGHLDAMLRGGWSLDKLFVQGRMFRHEAEIRVHALSQGHRARDVADTGSVGTHMVSSTLSAGSGSGKVRYTAVQAQVRGADTHATLGHRSVGMYWGAFWRLYSRVRTRESLKTLSAARVATEERAGRMVRAGYESTTYVAVGQARSRLVGAPARTAAAGVTVFGQRDEALDWDEARRLGLIDNGLEELVETGPLRPLLPRPAHIAVQGVIDVGPAVRTFQKKLHERWPDLILPESGVGDLGGLRGALNGLLAPDAVLGYYDQLAVEEGVTLRHFRNTLVGSRAGEVQVRLIRGAATYRRTRHGIDLEEKRSLTETSRELSANERGQGWGLSAVSMPPVAHDNDQSGSQEGYRISAVAAGLEGMITLPTSAARTATDERTRSHVIVSTGRHAELEVPLALELSYRRSGGKIVTVREEVGTVVELHAMPLLVPDSASPLQDAPQAEQVDFAAEASAPEPTSHASNEYVSVIPAVPDEPWLAEADNEILTMLRNPDVAVLDMPAADLARHAVQVLDHAAGAAHRHEVMNGSKDLVKPLPIRSDAPVPVNVAESKRRWGKSAPSPASKADVGLTSLTRPGTAPLQQLEVQLSNWMLRSKVGDALGEEGYRPPTLPDGSAVGSMAGDLTVRFRPTPGLRPRMLDVVDGVKVQHSTSAGGGVQHQDNPPGVESTFLTPLNPVIASQQAAIGALTPGDRMPLSQSAEIGRADGGATNAAQVGVRLVTERMVVYEIPIDQRVEARVTKSRLKRFTDALTHALRGLTRGSVRRPRQATQAVARSSADRARFAASITSKNRLVVLVPERLARAHGLLGTDRFPEAVTAAYDRVKELDTKIREAWDTYQSVVIAVERDYEELYEILREPDAQRRKERYDKVAPRLVDHEIERARRRDAHDRLTDEYRKARLDAREQLEWYQRDDAGRGDSRPPVAYEPDHGTDPAGYPLAAPDDAATRTADRGPAPYDDEQIRELAAEAESPGGIWPGAVPPRHLALREAIKAHAIAEALRVKQHELSEAQDAGDGDMAQLHRAEAAYLERARTQATEARDRMTRAIQQGMSELDDVPAGHLNKGRVIDVRPGEVEALRAEVRHQRRALRSAEEAAQQQPVHAALALLPSRAAHASHAKRAERLTTKRLEAASEALAERSAHVQRLQEQLRRAKVQQAVADFTRAHEPALAPSAFPPTALATDRPEAERRALEERELLNKPVVFEAGRDTVEGPVTHYTDLEGTVYDVLDPHHAEHPEATRGEGLPLALYAAQRAALRPKEDPRAHISAQTARNVRAALARQLRKDGEEQAAWLRSAFTEGGTWLQPEPGRDVFTEDDLEAAGLDDLEPQHEAEFTQDGTLHSEVPLRHVARIELLARQLERSGSAGFPDADRAGYDNAATDYIPLLFARAYGVEAHVVLPGQGVLVFHPDSPAPRRRSDLLRVHVLLDEDTFTALIPRPRTAQDTSGASAPSPPSRQQAALAANTESQQPQLTAAVRETSVADAAFWTLTSGDVPPSPAQSEDYETASEGADSLDPASEQANGVLAVAEGRLRVAVPRLEEPGFEPPGGAEVGSGPHPGASRGLVWLQQRSPRESADLRRTSRMAAAPLDPPARAPQGWPSYTASFADLFSSVTPGSSEGPYFSSHSSGEPTSTGPGDRDGGSIERPRAPSVTVNPSSSPAQAPRDGDASSLGRSGGGELRPLRGGTRWPSWRRLTRRRGREEVTPQGGAVTGGAPREDASQTWRAGRGPHRVGAARGEGWGGDEADRGVGPSFRRTGSVELPAYQQASDSRSFQLAKAWLGVNEPSAEVVRNAGLLDELVWRLYGGGLGVLEGVDRLAADVFGPTVEKAPEMFRVVMLRLAAQAQGADAVRRADVVGRLRELVVEWAREITGASGWFGAIGQYRDVGQALGGVAETIVLARSMGIHPDELDFWSLRAVHTLLGASRELPDTRGLRIRELASRVLSLRRPAPEAAPRLQPSPESLRELFTVLGGYEQFRAESKTEAHTITSNDLILFHAVVIAARQHGLAVVQRPHDVAPTGSRFVKVDDGLVAPDLANAPARSGVGVGSSQTVPSSSGIGWGQDGGAGECRPGRRQRLSLEEGQLPSRAQLDEFATGLLCEGGLFAGEDSELAPVLALTNYLRTRDEAGQQTGRDVWADRLDLGAFLPPGEAGNPAWEPGDVFLRDIGEGGPLWGAQMVPPYAARDLASGEGTAAGPVLRYALAAGPRTGSGPADRAQAWDGTRQRTSMTAAMEVLHRGLGPVKLHALVDYIGPEAAGAVETAVTRLRAHFRLLSYLGAPDRSQWQPSAADEPPTDEHLTTAVNRVYELCQKRGISAAADLLRNVQLEVAPRVVKELTADGLGGPEAEIDRAVRTGLIHLLGWPRSDAPLMREHLQPEGFLDEVHRWAAGLVGRPGEGPGVETTRVAALQAHALSQLRLPLSTANLRSVGELDDFLRRRGAVELSRRLGRADSVESLKEVADGIVQAVGESSDPYFGILGVTFKAHTDSPAYHQYCLTAVAASIRLAREVWGNRHPSFVMLKRINQISTRIRRVMQLPPRDPVTPDRAQKWLASYDMMRVVAEWLHLPDPDQWTPDYKSAVLHLARLARREAGVPSGGMDPLTDLPCIEAFARKLLGREAIDRRPETIPRFLLIAVHEAEIIGTQDSEGELQGSHVEQALVDRGRDITRGRPTFGVSGRPVDDRVGVWQTSDLMYDLLDDGPTPPQWLNAVDLIASLSREEPGLPPLEQNHVVSSRRIYEALRLHGLPHVERHHFRKLLELVDFYADLDLRAENGAPPLDLARLSALYEVVKAAVAADGADLVVSVDSDRAQSFAIGFLRSREIAVPLGESAVLTLLDHLLVQVPQQQWATELVAPASGPAGAQAQSAGHVTGIEPSASARGPAASSTDVRGQLNAILRSPEAAGQLGTVMTAQQLDALAAEVGIGDPNGAASQSELAERLSLMHEVALAVMPREEVSMDTLRSLRHLSDLADKPLNDADAATWLEQVEVEDYVWSVFRRGVGVPLVSMWYQTHRDMRPLVRQLLDVIHHLELLRHTTLFHCEPISTQMLVDLLNSTYRSLSRQPALISVTSALAPLGRYIRALRREASVVARGLGVPDTVANLGLILDIWMFVLVHRSSALELSPETLRAVAARTLLGDASADPGGGTFGVTGRGAHDLETMLAGVGLTIRLAFEIDSAFAHLDDEQRADRLHSVNMRAGEVRLATGLGPGELVSAATYSRGVKPFTAVSNDALGQVGPYFTVVPSTGDGRPRRPSTAAPAPAPQRRTPRAPASDATDDVAPAVDYRLVHKTDLRNGIVVESSPTELLWRFSNRPPEEIFQSGFHPHPDTLDVEDVKTLEDWVNAYAKIPTAPFISTTRADQGHYFSDARSYRYTVNPSLLDDPRGIDVYATLLRNNPLYLLSEMIASPPDDEIKQRISLTGAVKFFHRYRLKRLNNPAKWVSYANNTLPEFGAKLATFDTTAVELFAFAKTRTESVAELRKYYSPAPQLARREREVAFTASISPKAVISVYDMENDRTGWWNGAARRVQWDRSADGWARLPDGWQASRAGQFDEQNDGERRGVGPALTGEPWNSGRVRTDRWIPFGRRRGSAADAARRPTSSVPPPPAFGFITGEDGRPRVIRPDGSGERTEVSYTWAWYRGTTPLDDTVQITRRIHLIPHDTTTPDQSDELRDSLLRAVDDLVNKQHYRLPALQPDQITGPHLPGPLLHLTIEFTDTPDSADTIVRLHPGLPTSDQPMRQDTWYTGVHAAAYVHELLHGLGIRDDQPDSRALLLPGGHAPHPVPKGRASLMGPLRNVTGLTLTPDHLKQIADTLRPHFHHSPHRTT